MDPLLILTDLDGTLLDAATYAWDAARPALEAIRTRGIPLVLASSKTRAEVEPLRYALKHTDPFIVENGGAVFIPKGLFTFPVEAAEIRGPYQVIEIGTPYVRLRSVLKEAAQALSVEVKGFGDMTAEDVVERTGLTMADAVLAKQREYDEPFVLAQPDRLPELIRFIESHGLSCTRGGRFHHVLGPSDKGRAARELIAFYRRQLRDPHRPIVAFGDSLNDLRMLAAADRAFLVQRSDGTYDPDVDVPQLTRVDGIGPVGWNRAVLDLLQPSRSRA
jgi:mannosyl-3-phosphoglycerate phosphatase